MGVVYILTSNMPDIVKIGISETSLSGASKLINISATVRVLLRS